MSILKKLKREVLRTYQILEATDPKDVDAWKEAERRHLAAIEDEEDFYIERTN